MAKGGGSNGGRNDCQGSFVGLDMTLIHAGERVKKRTSATLLSSTERVFKGEKNLGEKGVRGLWDP